MLISLISISGYFTYCNIFIFVEETEMHKVYYTYPPKIYPENSDLIII